MHSPFDAGGQFSTPLWLLMAITGTLLLLACANLSLARAAVGEPGLAIGASRARAVRQWLIESLLLSILGTTLGLSLAFMAERLLPADAAGDLSISAVPDVGILAFTIALMFVTVLILRLRTSHTLTRH